MAGCTVFKRLAVQNRLTHSLSKSSHHYFYISKALSSTLNKLLNFCELTFA